MSVAGARAASPLRESEATMSAWTEAAGADAPFGKRRLRELAGTPLPESGVPAGLVGALERLVTTVNESTGPDRVLAFVALATAAVAPPARPLVLEALAGLAEDIDALLSAREDVRAGRGQGAWRRDLHEAVLVLLVRCQSYRLAATDVLELVRGDVGLCTELLARLLAVAAYEEDMGCAAARMLFELTLPATAAAATAATRRSPTGAASMTEHSLEEVTARAGEAAAMLVSPPGQEVLRAATAGLGSRLAKAERASRDAPRLFEAVVWLCRFLENAWGYASPRDAAALLGHFRVATALMDRLVLPGVAAGAAAVAAAAAAGAASESGAPGHAPGLEADAPMKPLWAGRCVLASLRLAALLGYRASDDAAVLAAVPALSAAASALLVGPAACQHRLGLAVLLAALVNCGAIASPRAAAAAASDAATAPSPARRAAQEAALASWAAVARSSAEGPLAARRVDVGQLLLRGSRSLPLARETAAFGAAMEALASGAGPAAAGDSASAVDRPQQGAAVESAEAAADAAAGAGTDAAAESGSGAPSEATTAAPAGTGHGAALAPASAAGPAREALGPLSDRRGGSPPAPYQTSAGPLLGELPALRRPGRSTGGGGGGGGGGRSLVHSDSDLDMAAAPAYRTREWAERQWRAMQSERQGREAKARLGGGGGAPPARAPDAVSAAAPPSSPVLATAAAKLAAGGDAGVPADFACGLDGNPMRDPVRRGGDAGSGPAFDRPAIEAWLQRGSTTCPVTGEPLTKADLAPCPELRSRISAWRAGVGAAGPAPRKAVAVMVGGAEELEGDALYDF